MAVVCGCSQRQPPPSSLSLSLSSSSVFPSICVACFSGWASYLCPPVRSYNFPLYLTTPLPHSRSSNGLREGTVQAPARADRDANERVYMSSLYVCDLSKATTFGGKRRRIRRSRRMISTSGRREKARGFRSVVASSSAPPLLLPLAHPPVPRCCCCVIVVVVVIGETSSLPSSSSFQCPRDVILRSLSTPPAPLFAGSVRVLLLCSVLCCPLPASLA